MTGDFTCAGSQLTVRPSGPFTSDGTFWAEPGSAGAPSTGPAPPSASSASDALASPVCDPWLTAAQITSVIGEAPVLVRGGNYQDPDAPLYCQWTLADTSYLSLQVGEQSVYGGPPVDENGDWLGGVLVDGNIAIPALGTGAFLRPASGTSAAYLDWFPDSALSVNLQGSLPNTMMVAIAQQVRIPPDWRSLKP